MSDDLDDSVTSAWQRQIGLRFEHIGLRMPWPTLRLDLYRLFCYCKASEHIVSESDGEIGCPWLGLRDDYQEQEIMRILLQTAVAVRYIGGGYADELRVDGKWYEESVGTLYKAVNQQDSEPLPLREACNKIIHAKNIVLDSNHWTDPAKRFIKPKIFSYEDFLQQTGWKAQIELVPFIVVADSLFRQF
jgi:hypothetical protein